MNDNQESGGDVFVWNDAYSVHVPLIDEQHQNLVKMTNWLFQANREKLAPESEILRKAIRDAVEYAQTHFFTEEKFMKKANYPELAAHKEQHAVFVATVKDACKKFDAGDFQLLNLANFLRNWLITHIAVNDKAFAPYLKNLPPQ